MLWINIASELTCIIFILMKDIPSIPIKRKVIQTQEPYIKAVIRVALALKLSF